MNELLQELAEQSTKKLHGFSYRFGHTTETMFDHEKFAELIVRQCGYYADVFESLGCPVDMDTTETKPSDYIKKYFGVEE